MARAWFFLVLLNSSSCFLIRRASPLALLLGLNGGSQGLHGTGVVLPGVVELL